MKNRRVTVDTTGGRLEGFVSDGVCVFKGVRYGETTAGERRFLPPKPAAPRAGTLSAWVHGPRAPQNMPPRSPAFAWMLGQQPQSEDCLTLNVFSPDAQGGALPVMVYFHGGGFAFGTSGLDVLCGEPLARQEKVVVVTVSHRLNAFGFLCAAQAEDSRFHDAGNAGLLDLVLALAWVRDNIAAFNGDPGNVTIFGQSGGGAKVALLMRIAAARPLFHKAVVQSTSTGFQGLPMEMAARGTYDVLRYFGYGPTELHRLQEVPATRLLEAVAAVARAAGGWDFFRPVDDGRTLLLPDEDGGQAPLPDIPVMLGYTRTEATFYLSHDPSNQCLGDTVACERIMRFLGISSDAAAALFARYRDNHPGEDPAMLLALVAGDYLFKMPTIKAAETLAAASRGPAFLYRFDAQAKDGLASPHIGDLPFIFGTLDTAAALFDDDECNRSLMRTMMRAWADFSRDGRPSASLAWQPFDGLRRHTMLFGPTLSCPEDPDRSDRTALAPHDPYVPGAPINFWQPGS